MLFSTIATYSLAGLVIGSLAAVPAPRPPKATIVLVHGAFADGSSWQRLIPLLEHDGYDVVAVQNAMASFPDDIATTKRLIDAQPGPIVVVGHSYGGAVMTAAAADNPRVKALVYIAAFAPEVNESVGTFGDRYPVDLGAALAPDAAGFLYVDRARFHALLAADLSAGDAQVLSATQKPAHTSVFAAPVDRAAWKTIPSWYIVTQEDRAINPDLERFYAKRMHAKVTEVKSSHLAILSHPRAVAGVIEQAATQAR